MVLEELERIAGTRGPERAGSAPTLGYGSICGDIGRDVVPGKEPDLDASAVPQHSVDTTAVAVERRAKRVALTRLNPATLIARFQRRTVRATDNITRDTERSDVAGRQLTTSVRVDRRLVVGVFVDALDDVDLAGLWPRRAVRPESGPRPTTSGHVDAVHDDEPTSEAVLRLDAHGRAISGHLGRGIDSHDRVSGTIDGREVARLRRRLRHILHISISGVGTREEVPSREKRVPGIRLRELEIGLCGRGRRIGAGR
jgi:hypothetical protein